MKKILFLFVALGLVCTAGAQKVAKQTNQSKIAVEKKTPKRGFEQVDFSNHNKVETKLPETKDPTLTQIGTTVYDLQTNSTLARRLSMHSDGTMSAVWTRGMQSSGWADRGTGYNYFDGSTWAASPDTRIEDVKTGWGAIAGPGIDFVAAHTATTLVKTYNTAFGASDWTTEDFIVGTDIPEPSWPQTATGGSDGNTIHLLASSYTNEWEGIVGNVGYCRSTNGGVDWDIKAVPLDGITSDKYFEIGGETYAIDALGETVAILLTPPYGDVVMLKSTDNGDSWTKKIIIDFPDSFEPFDSDTDGFDVDGDGAVDTLATADQSGTIVIDNNGKVHCAFGLLRYRPEGGSFYYPLSDGLVYWNEDMPEGVFSMDHVYDNKVFLNMQLGEDYDTLFSSPDLNGNDTIWEFYETEGSTDPPFGDYEVSITGFPQLVTTSDNDIIMVYTTVMETDAYAKPDASPVGQNYRHIWYAKMDATTGEWTDPVHFTDGESYKLYEHVFPICYRASEDVTVGSESVNRVHMFYMFDDEPGVLLNEESDPETTNYMFYTTIDVAGPDKINSIDMNDELFTMGPNPASESINIKTEKNADVVIYNLIGEEIFSAKCKDGSLMIDITNYAEGSYLVVVKSSKGIASQKLVKI